MTVKVAAQTTSMDAENALLPSGPTKSAGGGILHSKHDAGLRPSMMKDQMMRKA